PIILAICPIEQSHCAFRARGNSVAASIAAAASAKDGSSRARSFIGMASLVPAEALGRTSMHSGSFSEDVNSIQPSCTSIYVPNTYASTCILNYPDVLRCTLVTPLLGD